MKKRRSSTTAQILARMDKYAVERKRLAKYYEKLFKI